MFPSAYSFTISISEISIFQPRELESSFVSILSSKLKEVLASQVIFPALLPLVVSIPTQACICLQVYFDI
jgi:hypothetical protein